MEILAELRKDRLTELGIDKLTAKGNGDEPGLRDLFDRYIRSLRSPDPPNDATSRLQLFKRNRRAIALRIPIEGTVQESGEDWAVTYRSAEPVPSFKDMEVHCRPLTLSGDRRRIAPGTAVRGNASRPAWNA